MFHHFFQNYQNNATLYNISCIPVSRSVMITTSTGHKNITCLLPQLFYAFICIIQLFLVAYSFYTFTLFIEMLILVNSQLYKPTLIKLFLLDLFNNKIATKPEHTKLKNKILHDEYQLIWWLISDFVIWCTYLSSNG